MRCTLLLFTVQSVPLAAQNPSVQTVTTSNILLVPHAALCPHLTSREQLVTDAIHIRLASIHSRSIDDDCYSFYFHPWPSCFVLFHDWMSGGIALRSLSVDPLSWLVYELKRKRWWDTFHSAVHVTEFLNRWCKPCCHSTTSLTTVQKLCRWYFTTTAEITVWRWHVLFFFIFLSFSWKQLNFTIIYFPTNYHYVSHSAYFPLLYVQTVNQITHVVTHWFRQTDIPALLDI